MQKNQKKNIGIGIIAGAITTILVFGTVVGVWLVRALAGEITIITDIAQYEEALSTYSDEYTHTAFITFPETIPDSATNIEFYFSHEIHIVGSAIGEVFLQCTYDEADYRAEIERLENTYKKYGATEKGLLYEEERFAYPAYIAVDGHSSEYEYVLLSGERQITYIFVSYLSEEGLEKVTKEYMPYDYMTVYNQTDDELMENYSIYFIGKDEDTDSYSYDYTKDVTVKVWQHYQFSIGYNRFYVSTCLDENDTEIIQNCSFLYYDSKTDSIYGLPEEILYEELKGYKFKSVELNEDKTIATVTYYDDKEEKIMEYEIPEV